MVGRDIFRHGVEWLDRGAFPTGLNDTNVVLIPKCAYFAVQSSL